MDFKDKIIHAFSCIDDVSLPTGEESYSYGKKWINWGEDNLYPNYLQSLINVSTLHSSIMKQKAMLIGGCGFDKTNMSPAGLYFLKNIYNEDELDDILCKVSFDLELYGGFCLNIVWNEDRTKIAEINYLNPSIVRIQPTDKGFKYLVCDNWYSPYKNQPVMYDEFSTEKKQKANQILWVKEHREGCGLYPAPEYKPGIKWFEIDNMISDFHYTNLKSSFFPNVHINFPIGTPSAEEADQLVSDIKRQYAGAKGGKTIVTFSDTKETALTFDKIESTSTDEMFIMLNEMVEKSILKSHRVVNPSLFGIETPGSLGSRNEMLESLEIFQTSYVDSKQRLIERVFNRLRKINGVEDKIIINRYSPQFSKINTNISDILSILTADIEPKQKYQLLIDNSYSPESAINLTGYDPSINTQPTV